MTSLPTGNENGDLLETPERAGRLGERQVASPGGGGRLLVEFRQVGEQATQLIEGEAGIGTGHREPWQEHDVVRGAELA
jgi:hypothetical protein